MAALRRSSKPTACSASKGRDMVTFWLKVKCFFSMVLRDVRTVAHYRKVMASRHRFEIEKSAIDRLTSRLRVFLESEGMVRNILGSRENVVVQVALDDQCATLAFFDSVTTRDVVSPHFDTSLTQVVDCRRDALRGVFRYVYRNGQLEVADRHGGRYFDSKKPKLVLQPSHWDEEEIFGNIPFLRGFPFDFLIG